jgi:hypothetical protein
MESDDIVCGVGMILTAFLAIYAIILLLAENVKEKRKRRKFIFAAIKIGLRRINRRKKKARTTHQKTFKKFLRNLEHLVTGKCIYIPCHLP